jgi:hypothetical protein
MAQMLDNIIPSIYMSSMNSTYFLLETYLPVVLFSNMASTLNTRTACQYILACTGRKRYGTNISADVTLPGVSTAM